MNTNISLFKVILLNSILLLVCYFSLYPLVITYFAISAIVSSLLLIGNIDETIDKVFEMGIDITKYGISLIMIYDALSFFMASAIVYFFLPNPSHIPLYILMFVKFFAKWRIHKRVLKRI